MITRQYWLCIRSWAQNVFRLINTIPTKLLRSFEIMFFYQLAGCLTDQPTDWLTDRPTDRPTDWLDWLVYLIIMTLNKHRSRTAKATGFIYSLISVASSQDVPFYQATMLTPWCYLCPPFYPIHFFTTA